MSETRIKELQNFTEDFKRKLKLAKERFETSPSKSIDLSKEQKKSVLQNSNLLNKSPKVKNNKKIYVNNILSNNKILYLLKIQQEEDIFKEKDPWIPNSFFGKSLENFKKLNDLHYPTSWVIVNIFFIMNKNK